MKTKYKIIFLLSFFTLILSCQKKEDAVEYKSKVIILLQNLDSLNLKDVIKERALDTLTQYILAHNNDSINRNLIFKVVNKYYYLNKSKYLKLTNKVLELSSQKNDSANIAKSLSYIADYHNTKSQFDSAFFYYNKSEKIYKTLNNTLMLGTLSLSKGGVLFNSGNFAESETETVKALQLLLKAKNKDMIINCYNLIAISLNELKDYKKSLEYFDLALKQLDKLENENYSKKNNRKI